ncbi:MAG: hypothetical protein HDS64_02480 [Bacteroidales bacterium]|nr:hypothetical protein [Bacteroidales bacterium]
MEALQTIAKIAYATPEDPENKGTLRLVKILDLTYLVFSPYYNADDDDNFFIQTGEYILDGISFNAKATINYGENGKCFFNIPEKLVPLIEGL